MEVVDILKFEGDDKTLVWKSDKEDFNTGTQLIVHESQEAVFYRDGQALDLFGSGRYTLETANIPLLKKLINLPTDGKTRFHCEVYFINKAYALDVKWGTTSKFEVLDPQFFVQLNVGASGAMEVKIKDSRKFLVKVVGTQKSIDTARIQDYFKEKIIVKVKAHLAKLMGQISYVVINQHLEEISEAIGEKLNEEMDEYGVEIPNFYLSTIHIPDDEKARVQEALNKRMEQGILGYNWMDEQLADIAKRYVSNEGNGTGTATGMMAQMPMAFAFGQMLSNTAQPMMQQGMQGLGNGMANQGNLGGINLQNPTQPGANAGFMGFGAAKNAPTTAGKFCSECGTVLAEGTKFCPNCGHKVEEAQAGYTCKQCGRVLKENEKFCPDCGTKREE
ncbi:MAG: SPFH domain-containing protein [Clostridia bacterium]|nr:SPFH domain-containing protein [Clostridia bacterium]